MRGAVPAGMCVALEEAGLIAAFDRIYGCSSGALAGCFAAAGLAGAWATSFEDAATRAFIDPRRALQRLPVLDLGYLFDTVIRGRRPLPADGLTRGPELRTLAVAERDATLRVLGGFADADDALTAVRASCTIPLLAGAPLEYRGERLVDGGLLEPIPYRSALREGATHVLVLRSRPATFRNRTHPRATDLAVARAHPRLAPLLRTCHARYNEHASELDRLAAVRQVAPPPGARLVRRFSVDPARIEASIRIGVDAMRAALAPAPALAEPATQRVLDMLLPTPGYVAE
jgi:predicted patatin/cPLA2 family phospholipase